MEERVGTRNLIQNCIVLAVLLLAGIPTQAQKITITPSTPPAVNQGTTFKFTANTAVKWSCPGCAGTIDADGTYHAPQSVKAQQSYGGFQLLPNNHIYNTRIDSLPTHPNSNTWIAGAGTIPVNYLQEFPINYVNSSTPTQNMVFAYTAGNNGSFQIPKYPEARIQGGWFVKPVSGVDRHLFTIDTTSGMLQEIYDYFAPGVDVRQDKCPLCTSMSGIRYSNSTYNLPNAQGGGVDAAGLYMIPLILRLQELEQAVQTGGTIKHALRMTLQNGYIHPAAMWPATAFANAGMGVNFYGERLRLKSSFNISGFSPIAQILLTQLKQYGLIIADGGYGWQVSAEYTRWPANYLAAFTEIAAARIAPTNFEAVDESSLEVSPTSGLTKNAETVVATSISNPSASARQVVVLTGITLTMPKDELYFQAGAAAQQLTALIQGTSNRAIDWSMNPIVGNLTSDGIYTPPTTVGAATSTTISATSAADPSVAATLTLTVLPGGTIRLVLGQPAPYTDSQGNVWQNEVGDDGCQPYDSGGTWPNTPDIGLYKIPCFAYNDIRFDINVPNGNYTVMGKFACANCKTVGYHRQLLESQGQVLFPNLDLLASAGGANIPRDFMLPATVTNGTLSFVVRALINQPSISALQITPVSYSGLATPAVPTPPSNVQILVK